MTPTPELQRQYDELVTAIAKAVPWKLSDKNGLAFVKQIHHDDQVLEEPNRPITLEDVLRALADNGRFDYAVTVRGEFFNHIHSDEPSSKGWTHGKDLAWHRDNAPETIKFLHSLLLP